MSKNNFSEIDTTRVYDAISEAAAEPTPGPEKISKGETELKKPLNGPGTLKAPYIKNNKVTPICFKLTPENYEYVYIMARVSGRTITGFINYIIEQSREANGEVYEKAIEFFNAL